MSLEARTRGGSSVEEVDVDCQRTPLRNRFNHEGLLQDILVSPRAAPVVDARMGRSRRPARRRQRPAELLAMPSPSLAKSQPGLPRPTRKRQSMNLYALQRSLAFVAALGSPPSVALAQGPGQVGAWDPPLQLPLIAIHSAVLPTGKVLLFSAEQGVPGVHEWILVPTTLAFTNVDPPPPWNPDCAWHSFLSEGGLLVTGGTLSFTPLTGSKLAFLFDPWTEQWVLIVGLARAGSCSERRRELGIGSPCGR